MSLLDRLREIENEKPVNICPVKRLLDQLDAETAGVLLRLLDSRTPTRLIHRELKADGYKIARETISTHRSGWCACSANKEQA